MKFLALVIFAIAVVSISAVPSVGWWGGHGAVAPGAVVAGPAGTIHVGPSSAGAVVPGWGGHGVWGPWGTWGHGVWGHHAW